MKSYESYLGNTYWVQDNSFASGGEGAIYDVHNYYNTVVKIYNPSKRTEHQEKKLKTMLSVKLDDNVAKQFAWPIDIIYQNGSFVGFVMKKIQGVPLNVINSDYYKDLPLNKKITIAKNLVVVSHNIHQTGNLIGDMNPNNILVCPQTGLVSLIDCDSFHITDSSKRATFRCEVAMAEYLAPCVSQKLAKGESLKTAYLPTFTKASDNFSLAIHIFQLLMAGTHPFALAIDSTRSKNQEELPQPSENIKKGIFPYDKCPEGFKLPIYALPFEALPETLRALFIKCFSNGEYVAEHELFDALCEYEAKLKTCKTNHNHEYRKGLRKCPYCSAEKSTAKMLGYKVKPKLSSAKSVSAKASPVGKFFFWTISLLLAVVWQIIGYHAVGFSNVFVEDIASFVGLSYQSLPMGYLNINCVCGLIAAFIYNCTTRKRMIRIKNYFFSQLFSIFGFLLGFLLMAYFT